MELIINTTALTTLGFTLSGWSGFFPIAARKNTSGSDDKYSSQNPYPIATIKESTGANLIVIGLFDTIALAETALYSLIGILADTGEKTFQITHGANTIGFIGIMDKGIKTDYYKFESGIAIVSTISLLKTADYELPN
jgi:hypothetical protein